MKSNLTSRSALFFGGLLMSAAALLMPGTAAPTYARVPLAVTETPRVPPTAAPPSSNPNTSDPYITQTGPNVCVKPGDTMNLSAVVGLNGNTAAVNVQALQTLPAGLELVSVTASRGAVIINGNSYIVDIGTLNLGELINITIVVRVTGNPGQAVNVITLKSTTSGDNQSNNVAFFTYEVCAPVLPVTGAADTNTGFTFGLLLAGTALMLGSAALRRKTAV
jgi:uncharacterized repeat protein (TIGR01451 family)